MQLPVLPAGWLHRPGNAPADDLDLAVLLVNSVDNLCDPPDRLTAVGWYATVLTMAGHPRLADELRPGDLEPLRALRDTLTEVFAATSTAEVAHVLNPLLMSASAVSLLVVGRDRRATLRVTPEARGLAALAARLPAALASTVATHGLRRIGICAASPCRCAYIDRTRSANRRFCCDLCNDRVSAAAYRRRRAGT